MKNKIIYISIAAAAIAAGGVFFFHLFSSDSERHQFSKLSAPGEEKPHKAIGAGGGDSGKNFEATAPNVDGRKENLSTFGEQKPGRPDPAAQPGTAKDEHESEFEIDVNTLKELFPGNLAVPSVSDEERLAKVKAREERNEAYGLIAANKATDAQIQSYYEQQARLAEDSIEIIEFILENYRDRLGERERAKQEFLLQQFQRRLESIPKKKQEALRRLKAKQGEKPG